MKGFGGGMQNLMKQANQMQNRMKKMQEEFSKKEFLGTAGGGAVEVKVSGEYLVLNLKVDPQVIESGVEMASEMIQLATNDAIKAAKADYKKEMDGLTGGMSLPGMF